MWDQLKKILPYVEKPARYIGGEINSIFKDSNEISVRIALAFPDLYEIGSSYMGFQILYEIINDIPWAQGERVFAPWPDMEAQLREKNIPLYGLESKKSLAEFDLVGFTLQYELGYTNLLNMLDLAGIPLYASERKNLPLVIAGGPGALSPEPLADFIDAFVLGEGEELLPELLTVVAKGKKQGLGRQEILKMLGSLAGIYVPEQFSAQYSSQGEYMGLSPKTLLPLKRRVLKSFADFPLPKKSILPFVQPVHDRVSIEICRGCARGCRFCQAGMLYRPVRERPLAQLISQGSQLLKTTGSNEISLSSLSSADYSQIETLVREMMKETDAAVSLPSLRVDSFSVGLAHLTKAIRNTGLTLAPEAGSQRLRNIINKNVSRDDILAAVSAAYANGWDNLKLYFMVGLPEERDSDIEEIVHLVREIDSLAKKRGKRSSAKITIAVSTFVPKAHTPFQWSAFSSREEVERRQRILRTNLRSPRFKVQTMDWEESRLEALLARGGRNIGRAVFLAWQKGCRFDAWTEHFQPDLWEAAFAEANINPDDVLREIPTVAVLPWDHIDVGVSKAYLLQERERAKEELVTPDCSFTGCVDCGVCKTLAIDPIKRRGEDRCE